MGIQWNDRNIFVSLSSVAQFLLPSATQTLQLVSVGGDFGAIFHSWLQDRAQRGTCGARLKAVRRPLVNETQFLIV